MNSAGGSCLTENNGTLSMGGQSDGEQYGSSTGNDADANAGNETGGSLFDFIAA